MDRYSTFDSLVSGDPARDSVDQLDISVVVPFYNSEQHIEDCIQSLLAQTIPSSRYEIIMVDNNSTDNSAAIVLQYPRIKLAVEKKQSAYAARNRGVAASRGRIIAFTDADCVPDGDWLQQVMLSLTSPALALVQGRRSYGNESSALAMLEAYESERAAYTFASKSPGLYYGYTNNMAVRREVLDRAGPFLEIARGADSIFVHRVIDHYSCDAIGYAGNAHIRHLELNRVRTYFHKKFIYGKSFQLNYEIRKSAHRPVTLTERFEIVRRTVRRQRYSLVRSLVLAVGVTGGMLAFTAGRLWIKLSGAGRR